jgi:hypothetical protein
MVYSVPGVVTGNSLETLFICTSTATNNIVFGVELFARAGHGRASTSATDGWVMDRATLM